MPQFDLLSVFSSLTLVVLYFFILYFFFFFFSSIYSSSSQKIKLEFKFLYNLFIFSNIETMFSQFNYNVETISEKFNE